MEIVPHNHAQKKNLYLCGASELDAGALISEPGLYFSIFVLRLHRKRSPTGQRLDCSD